MYHFPTVFIASSLDPKEEITRYRWAARDAVLQAQMSPIMFEYYRKQYGGGTPAELSQEMIDVSDIFVGFYSGQYGESKVDVRDWAEFEYDYAVASDKPMILFFPTDNHDWTINADGKFLAFKTKVRQQSGFHQTYVDENDLKAQLVNALTAAKLKAQFDSRLVSVPIFGKAKQDPPYKVDVFVMIPFKGNPASVYRDCVKPVIEAMGLTIKRGDDFPTDAAIIDEIWAATYHANVLIVDITDLNPNVFYELAIAHMLGKKTIIIAEKGTEIPFDVRHRRIIFYDRDNLPALQQTLTEAFK